LAALIATVLAPILAQLFNLPTAIVVATSGMGVLIFWRHRSNIRNLLANTEDKIGGSGLDT
ncbi:MAG TPA: glycerol-3-phosphate acyltransferase, partial [Gammaproteobacteria bacterium]|nr:glycerol-3-phosphate acyltransferase [Gammaproteobacteria bacterium]